MATTREIEGRLKLVTQGDLEAVDKLSRDLRELDRAEDAAASGANRLERETRQAKGQVDDLGKKATISKTAIAGMGAVGLGTLIAGLHAAKAAMSAIIEASETQAQAEAKLRSTIESTGKAAGLSAEQLIEMAGGLQKVTLFGDETIIQAQDLLLTFTKIGGDIFPRATQAILDMATTMDGDLKGATIQIGKALNDPIKGITALGRAGIQFSEQQKQMIATLVETGQAAKAQELILKELETQFGGSAEAAAKASSGLQQVKNVFGDMLEDIGEGGLLDAVRILSDELLGLSESGTSVAQDLGKGLGTALVSIIGTIKMTESAWSSFQAHSEMAIKVVVAAVAEGVVKIAETLEDIPGLGGIADKIKNSAADIRNQMALEANEARRELTAELKEWGDEYQEMMDRLANVAQASYGQQRVAADEATAAVKRHADASVAESEMTQELADSYAQQGKALTEATRNLVMYTDEQGRVVIKQKEAAEGMESSASSMEVYQDALGNTVAKTKELADGVQAPADAAKQLADSISEAAGDVESMSEAQKKSKDASGEQSEGFETVAAKGEEVKNRLQGMFDVDASGLIASLDGVASRLDAVLQKAIDVKAQLADLEAT